MSVPSLPQAVERLYVVFERYPLRDWTDPCLHCHDEAEERELHRATLRNLSGEQLAGFGFDVLSVWGDVRDLKHFLPRILELLARRSIDLDVEHFITKLAEAEWHGWPGSERAAIHEFLVALFSDVLSTMPPLDLRAVRASDLVCGIANVEDDLEPYLNEWARLLATGSASQHLAAFIEEEARFLNQGRLGNAFFRVGRVAQAKQIHGWLRSDALLNRVIERSPLTDKILGFLDWIVE